MTTIVPRIIEEELKSSYLLYSLSVIVGRALPDVRDGLKPVHRRILYAMRDLGLVHSKPFKKCARIVGECFTKETLITTARGMIPIIDVKRGDIVYTKDGIEIVKELFEMPEKPILSLTLTNGQHISATESQKFMTFNESFQYEWKNAKDITTEDWIVMRSIYPEIQECAKIKIAGNVCLEIDENIAYIIGQFLSDGWVEQSSGRYCFFSSSKGVVEKISEAITSTFGYIPTIETKKYEYQTATGTLLLNQAYQVRINRKEICLLLSRTMGTEKMKARTKIIPQIFFSSPKRVIGALLSGLLDGDGSIHKTRSTVTYSSISEKLIDQLLLLTQQLGAIGKKYKNYPKAHIVNNRMVQGKYPSYSIEWNGLFAQKMGELCTLHNEKRKTGIQRIQTMQSGKNDFEVIPFSEKVLFSELINLHKGSGRYTNTQGKKFRMGIRYPGGGKIRYSSDLLEKPLRKSQIVEWGILKKLEILGSSYTACLKNIIENNIFFLQVSNIEKKNPEKTYDIQTGESHEFIAQGMIVHNCLGKYHPHGDVAVYDALVRLAQDFSMRYPLVEGQGNFGSVDGDSPASMRYTEARLQKISEELLSDLDKETVDFVPNFDSSLTEPKILPSKIPNLLINGSNGIAVGMATNIPPHNMKETCNALIQLIKNSECTTKELMTQITGPDFPTGGIICGAQGIREAYETGRGKIIVRAKTKIEENKKKQSLIITEIPFLVNKSQLVESIAELVQEKKITGISDIRDESDRDGIRVVLELKSEANSDVVTNQLFKHTRLQDSVSIIMLAIVDGQPKILPLKEMLKEFLKHRIIVVRRRTEYDLKIAKERVHIVEGLLKALENIDGVVELIKKSENPKTAQQALQEKYFLTEAQSTAILDMKLQRLTGLEQNRLREEHSELLKNISEWESVLSSEQKVLEIIINETTKIIETYGDERKTIISNNAETLEEEDLIKPEESVITVSREGYVKRLGVNTYRQQKRGGRGVVGAEARDGDRLESLFIANTQDSILCFTNHGKIHWMKAYAIPEAGRYAKGTALANLLQLSTGERVTSCLAVTNFGEGCFVFMASRKGIVKKVSLSEFSNPRKGGIAAINLGEGDELSNVALTDGERDILIATKDGCAIHFNEKTVRPMGRTAQGVIGIRLIENDEVIGALVDDERKDVLTITSNGFGKRTAVEEYRITNRGGVGVTNVKLTEKNGRVVAVLPVGIDDEIILMSKGGVVVRIPVQQISKIGRSTQGVRVMKLEESDEVVSATVVRDEEMEV